MKQFAINIAVNMIGVGVCVSAISMFERDQAIWGFLLCFNIMLIIYNSVGLGVEAQKQDQKQQRDRQ